MGVVLGMLARDDGSRGMICPPDCDAEAPEERFCRAGTGPIPGSSWPLPKRAKNEATEAKIAMHVARIGSEAETTTTVSEVAVRDADALETTRRRTPTHRTATF
jgi:hypothetical protein